MPLETYVVSELIRYCHWVITFSFVEVNRKISKSNERSVYDSVLRRLCVSESG